MIMVRVAIDGPRKDMSTQAAGLASESSRSRGRMRLRSAVGQAALLSVLASGCARSGLDDLDAAQCAEPLTWCPEHKRCADTRNDPQACGGCSVQCSEEELCTDGECVPWCMARFSDVGRPTGLRVQSTRWLSGIPRAAIVFRILHPTRASTRCRCNVRLLITEPISAL